MIDEQELYDDHNLECRGIHEIDTRPLPQESGEIAPMPALEPGKVVVAAARTRVFEALFQVPAKPQRMGRYYILGPLGRGAMGTVVEAFDHTLDRRVAVKVLYRTQDEQQTQRLLREAQALAKLSHPNVVQVYDADEIDGQAFVAMELVEGQTLAEWARREPAPSWRECVQVYLQAGEGLAAAHARSLVHRDFKPSNAIVDSQGRARVLDFGLARLVAPAGDTGSTIPAPTGVEEHTPVLGIRLTHTGTVMGTPAYMPLEQIEGREADARSDQFSFCASLFEALYGKRPFVGDSLVELGAEQLEGRIIPASRDTKVPARLREVLVRGLAAEPEARWPSMDALLAELRRFVTPRGRRWMVLGMAGGLAVVGAGLGVGQYADVIQRCTGAQAQLVGIWDEARRQEVEAAILGTGVSYAPSTWERVEARLDDYSRAWANKHTEVCEATAVRHEQSEDDRSLRMGCLYDRKMALSAQVKALAQANSQVVEKTVQLVIGLPELTRCDDVQRLAEQRQRVPPPEDPKVAAEVEALRDQLKEIGTEQELGKYNKALKQAESAFDQAKILGYMPLVAETKLRRGNLQRITGKYTKAEQDLTDAYQLALAHGHGEVAQDAASNLAVLVGHLQARHSEGVQWGQTALALAEHLNEPTSVASSMGSLGKVLRSQGKYKEAEVQFRRALEIQERALDSRHPDIAASVGNLGLVLNDLGKYEEAEAQLRRALEIREQASGENHPDVAISVQDLGITLADLGKHEAAEALFRRALEIQERALGASYPDVAWMMHSLGSTLDDPGKHEEEDALFRRALKILERALNMDHPNVAAIVGNRGLALKNLGKYEEAEALFRRALEMTERALGTDHLNVAFSVRNLGIAIGHQGKYEESEAQFRRALEIQERALGTDHPDVAFDVHNLGTALSQQGKYEEAEAQFRRAVEMRERALGTDHPNLARSVSGLGAALGGQGKYEEEEAQLRRALEIQERALEANHPDVAQSLHSLGSALSTQGEYEEAEAKLRQALEIRERALGANHPSVASSLMGLAKVALMQHAFKTAREHAKRAVSIREAHKVAPQLLANSRFMLARALWPDRAKRPRARKLAQQARDAFAEHGPGYEDDLAEVDAWLTKHRVR